MKSLVKERYHSELRSIDWDFTGERGSRGFAAYHWYPARFVPQLPGILINYFSEAGETVLDPFCGSGTTLLEAYKVGRRAVGVDINPVAVLMAQAKLVEYKPREFSEYRIELVARAERTLVQIKLGGDTEQRLQELVPNYNENILWYEKSTLLELAAIWTALDELSKSEYALVGRAAFSAILLYCCSQSKHWGWVCDNVKPKELVYKKAVTPFLGKLNEYEEFAKELQIDASQLQEKQIALDEVVVKQGDCVDELKQYARNSFELVVTSPPYFNMTDYVKSQRLSNLWFGITTDNIKKKEIGARFKRGRKQAMDEFLKEMRRCFVEVCDVLKPGRFCCVILGESPQHATYISEFESLCDSIGLKINDTLTRKVPAGRALVPSMQTEKILILRKE